MSRSKGEDKPVVHFQLGVTVEFVVSSVASIVLITLTIKLCIYYSGSYGLEILGKPLPKGECLMLKYLIFHTNEEFSLFPIMKYFGPLVLVLIGSTQ